MPQREAKTHGPTSIWNGTITFGLVTVPVKVYSATESKTVHFHEVHANDGSPIEHRRICPEDDKEVDYEDVVKGFEVTKGKWVELTDDEIAAAAGSQTRRSRSTTSSRSTRSTPTSTSSTYYLGPRDKGKDAYAMLHAALEKSGRAGVGRWVFHNRERTVVAAHARATCSPCTRCASPTSSSTREDFELGRVQRKPTEREIKMAAALVEGLHTKFDPTGYEDTYREAVLEVVERKAEGKNIEPPEDVETESADDLLAALEASLAKA